MRWKGDLYLTKPKKYNNRCLFIKPNLLGKTITIRNGKIVRRLLVSAKHLDLRIGCFFFTKKRPQYLKAKKKKKRKGLRRKKK